MIGDARSGDIGVTEPFLHLGDVGLLIERVGGGGRAQRMRADQKPQLPRVTPHQSIDAVRGDRVLQSASAVVANRPEQCAGFVKAVPGGVATSISDLERRAILRPRAPVIVNARGGNVGVAEPLLHLGDVGLVVERVGGGGRAQRMRADLEPEFRRIGRTSL